MNGLDWSVVVVYLVGMIGLSWHLGRRQADATDYYLGGNNLSWWSVGISTMATQCSTNSLLGAPAFVITTGLLWIQYEFALPLAMVFIMIFLIPFYRKLNLVSVYAYQERRFGRSARTVLSVTFQFLRAFATGVTVYGISIVLQSIVGIPFALSVLILGVVTVIYDMLGGMAAVVLSDVIQMVILYLGIALCVVYSVSAVGGVSEVFTQFSSLGSIVGADTFVGLQTVDFSGTGFTADTQYGFWPMLLGGLFLYVSYYGTDQTQVQRELSSKDIDDTNRSLMLNGMMRFPLVATYCFLGVCIGAYIVKNPEFLLLLDDGGEPNYNLAVPKFVTSVLPHGVIGLVMVALFSAAMSSLDSTINSLSAATIKDLYEPFVQKGEIPADKQLTLSRFFTVGHVDRDLLLLRWRHFQLRDRVGQQGWFVGEWSHLGNVPPGNLDPLWQRKRRDLRAGCGVGRQRDDLEVCTGGVVVVVERVGILRGLRRRQRRVEVDRWDDQRSDRARVVPRG